MDSTKQCVCDFISEICSPLVYPQRPELKSNVLSVQITDIDYIPVAGMAAN